MDETNFMRRIQWARFMNQPITLTEREALALLFDAASDSDYDDVNSEADFWHSRRQPNGMWSRFMLPADEWPFHDWDTVTQTWARNARYVALIERREALRAEYNADRKAANAKYGRWHDAVERLKIEIANTSI